MRYVIRIVSVIVSVVAVSAVVANLAFDSSLVQSTLSMVGIEGLFVGLLTSGLVGALLSKDYWLAV